MTWPACSPSIKLILSFARIPTSCLRLSPAHADRLHEQLLQYEAVVISVMIFAPLVSDGSVAAGHDCNAGPIERRLELHTGGHFMNRQQNNKWPLDDLSKLQAELDRAVAKAASSKIAKLHKTFEDASSKPRTSAVKLRCQ